MPDWYYSIDEEQRGPVSETEMQSLVQSGQVPGNAFIWSEGMDQWATVDSVFPGLGSPTAICAVSGRERPVTEMIQYGDQYVSPENKDRFVQSLREGGNTTLSSPTSPPVNGYFYQDPRMFATTVTVLFSLLTIVEILMSAVYFVPAESALTLGAFFGLAFFILYILGIIFFCIWKNRVARNCRVLSPGRSLSFSPGWAVGWYFIPIFNLWKPYQAMMEIWHSTFRGTETADQTAVVGWWWFLWIVGGILGNLSFRLANADMMEVSSVIDLITSVLSVFLLISIVTVIRRISTQQACLAEEKVN